MNCIFVTVTVDPVKVELLDSVKPEPVTIPEKPTRSRKAKQTILKDYFSVQTIEVIDESNIDSTLEESGSKSIRSSRSMKSKNLETETRLRTPTTLHVECQETIMEIESNQTNVADQSSSTPPKKRGRPRKSFGVFNETEAPHPSDIVETVHNETISSETSNISNVNEHPSNSFVENKTKRRGRPSKKQLQENTTNQSIKEENEMADATSPKYTCGNCKENVLQKKWKAHEAIHYGVTWRDGIDEAIDCDDSAAVNRLMIKFMKAHKLPYFRCPKCSEKKKSALGYISHVDLCGLTPDEIKAMKAECPYCKQLYRKISLPSHIQGFCTVRRLELIQQQADESIKEICDGPAIDETEEVVYTESGRPKRIIKKVKTINMRLVEEFVKIGLKVTGGVIKGWNGQLIENGIIKCPNVNCTFTVNDVNEMRTHFNGCREKINQCKLCSLTLQTKEEIVQHIEKEHEDVLKAGEVDDVEDEDNDVDFKAVTQSSTDDDDSFDGANDDNDSFSGKKTKRKCITSRSTKRNRTIPLGRLMENESPEYWEMLETFYKRIMNTRPGYYRFANEWTKTFTEQHYNQNALALGDHLRDNVDYVRLGAREIVKYLNILNPASIKYSCQKGTEYGIVSAEVNDWNALNSLESRNSKHINDETSILYCGGKIIHVDWIPFPDDYTGNQILVICTHNKNANLISPTNCGSHEKHSNLIQLWSISSKSATELEKAEFLYGIAYDDGPIFTMNFCPSDAYVATKRLAILAIPDTNGNVNIFSLPETVPKAKNNANCIIKLMPEMRLQLNFDKLVTQPQTITQLTWSRTKGHKIICAGYNTGLVAVWNFEHLNSSYMRKQIDDIPVILPKQSFIGALSCITQLDLHSDKDNNGRWLLCGAIDRKVRLYDLNELALIPFTSTLYKSRIISGAWPLHWPIYLTIIDAALTRLGGGMNIKQILYTNNQTQSTNLLNDSEPSNLAFSDWLNTAIFGNDAGDLFMINFQQLLVHDRNDDSSKLIVLSMTDVLDNEPTIEEQNDQLTIDMNKRIIFTDFDQTILAPKLKMRLAPLEVFPFTKINKVSINPNESHQKMYAIGYELGFCRIRFLP